MGIRVIALAVLALAACTSDDGDDESRQGGDTTVDDRTINAFAHAAPNLSTDEKSKFMNGTSPFDFKWEIPQLGPVFNNDSCFNCHSSFGRGLSQIGPDGMTDINGPLSEALVRVSLPEGEGAPDVPGGVVPVPGYGDQLQDHATVGLAEVATTLTWIEHTELFGDGTTISLRAPSLDLRDLSGAVLPADMRRSYRIAPAMIGLGLLEALDDATLAKLADPDDTNGDGISGRLNMVWNPETNQTERGRFGWKANAPTLHVQASGAARNDIGLTSYVFPDPSNNNDLADEQLDAMAFMVSAIAVPAAAPRDARATQGRKLFDTFGCSSCHIPTLVTGDSSTAALAHQTIHPYTDMLLHDMGDSLTDSRPDFEAEGIEWRTPALWGIGLAQLVRADTTFLHDGRARTFEEAIMWHGGEAQAAHDAFQAASKADRDALAAFLATL
ncbi:MAG: di-heme oxidoredictase family protein [Kofleriaceae bacterium]